MFNLPKDVEVIAFSNEEAEEFTKNATAMGSTVTNTSVWTGPVPPNSFIELAPGIRMASPEYMFLRKANQLPHDDAVVVGCALLSCFDTCFTAPSLGPDEVYWRDEPHTTVESIIEYLTPIIFSDEAMKAIAILKESVEYLLPFDAWCEVIAKEYE